MFKNVGLNINVGTHTMRKTFGYHHYKQFNDVALLQKILNHSSPSITLRYISIYQEEIDSSYNSFELWFMHQNIYFESYIFSSDNIIVFIKKQYKK